MAVEKELFQGCEILIEDKKLTINGVEIDVVKAELGNYITSYLPYTDYETVSDLAKAIVRYAPNFRSKT